MIIFKASGFAICSKFSSILIGVWLPEEPLAQPSWNDELGKISAAPAVTGGCPAGPKLRLYLLASASSSMTILRPPLFRLLLSIELYNLSPVCCSCSWRELGELKLYCRERTSRCEIMACTILELLELFLLDLSAKSAGAVGRL